MNSVAALGAPLRFATRDMRAEDRIPLWREVLGRKIVNIDIEPEAGQPFTAEASLYGHPGFRMVTCDATSPATWKRTNAELQDGNDDLSFMIVHRGSITRSMRRHEVEAADGQAFCIFHDEPGAIRFRDMGMTSLILPRAALTPLIGNIEKTALPVIQRNTEALLLLQGYVRALQMAGPVTDPAVANLAAAHVCDLVALAVGATGDGREIAGRRGARAARLQAMRTAIVTTPSITLTQLASLQGVSPRYIQVLFEETGTTFTATVVEQRLQRAHRLLTDPRYAMWSVAAIAFEAGFGDVSHFNRKFKQRFDGSPSEVRAEALRKR